MTGRDDRAPSERTSTARRATSLSRRGLLGAAVAVGVGAIPPGSTAAASPRKGPGVVEWIDHHARPLQGIDPTLPHWDLNALRPVTGAATIVGLGESAHGTHDQFALKHRITRYLVERLGFRTLAWEDSWAAGVAVDRYITGGPGDPREIVADCGFNLQNEAMLDLMAWLRRHNATQPQDRRVRFLGADVTQLRERQFTELERHVEAVDPDRLPALGTHLAPLRIRQSPGNHTGWFSRQPPHVQDPLVAHARAVQGLIQQLPDRPSPISRLDAELHALTLRGFYESYTAAGLRQDVRDVYIADILRRWRSVHDHRLVYSAANAHTVAADHQTVSFPPVPPLERSLVGGRLRDEYGSGYVSIGLTFDHGAIRAGWDTGRPSVLPVPRPSRHFIDHQLGAARLDDYILNLRRGSPPEVRAWLHRRGRLRVIGGASYDPAADETYYMELDRWGDGFDSLIHLRTVEASRLP